jgi:hypothetical protein
MLSPSSDLRKQRNNDRKAVKIVKHGKTYKNYNLMKLLKKRMIESIDRKALI